MSKPHMAEEQIENVYLNVRDSFLLAMEAAGIEVSKVDAIRQTVEDAITNHFDELTEYSRNV